MASTTIGAAIREVGRLFDEGGATVATTDGPLLGRFLDRGDALAFETLVARHGPMVLATARAVLRDRDDAEDAFQATFLALVRAGGSIRGRDALGGWLHRVAHRVAVRSNIDATRRRDRERLAGLSRPSEAPAGRDEAVAAVHDELARLPDRFRLPVVLCHLEGKTHAQAADELGWGEATVRRRLAGARDRLRHRLTRRGYAPSALIALGSKGPAVPSAWVARMASGWMPGPVASALASAGLRAVAVGRLGGLFKAALGLAAMAGLALGAGGQPGEVARPAPAPVAAADGPAPGDEDVIRGVVLGPDGRPVAGARVGVRDLIEPVRDDQPRTTSGPDGRFEIRPKPGAAAARGARRVVHASAEGFGLAWATPGDGEVTLRLAADDAPIRGRIVDLEGRPVRDAEVGVFWLAEPRSGVESFLAAARSQGEIHGWLPGDNPSWLDRVPGQPAYIAVDADGRFRIDGLGRDRIVELVVRGPTIAEGKVTVLTRRMDPIVGPASTRPQPEPPPPFTLRGADFDYPATPSRPIAGVVRDRATGRPVAGIRVRSTKVAGKALDSSEGPAAISDAEGRYALLGHPKAATYTVVASPPAGSAYIDASAEAADTAGLGPIRLDVALAAGIPFRVRPVDASTGRPVEAKVEYYPLKPNPNVARMAGKGAGMASLARAERQADGWYAGVILPGPGAICVTGLGDYIRTRVDPWAFFRPGEGPRPSSVLLYGDDSTLILEMGEGGVGITSNDHFHDIHLVNPGKDPVPIEWEARLLPAPRLVGTVVDPDGKPLAGSRIHGLDGYPVWSPASAAPRFAATRLDPARPRALVFRHDGRKLAGQHLLTVRGQVGPVVKLQPWATLTGRLVAADGRPRPGLKLLPPPGPKPGDPTRAAYTDWIQTDPEGRFRLEGVVPGLALGLAVMDNGGISDGSTLFDDLRLQPGETRDLGDVRVESDRPGFGR